MGRVKGTAPSQASAPASDAISGGSGAGAGIPGSLSTSTPGRFECSVPGCKKAFRRKEHLTRHFKSHDAQPQYVCHICGRRYARSDVLRRHVEFHPQYYKSKRDFIACTRCRESKMKCDEDSPCGPCRRRELRCVRGGKNDNSSNNNNERGDDDDGEGHLRAGGGSGEDSTPLPEQLPFRPPNQPHPSISHVLESRLGDCLARDAAGIQRRLGVYYAGIHPSWPVLRPAMALPSQNQDILLASMLMLASWHDEEDTYHQELFPLVLGEFAESQTELSPPVPTLQAMTLCLLYCLCCLAEDGMALKALRLHSTLVTACRFAGVFAPQRGMLYAPSHAPIVDGDEHQEELYRLAFAVLRIDAYLSAMLDLPPLVRYQELSIPLSQTTGWVDVGGDSSSSSNSEEQQRRQRQLLDTETTLRRTTSFGLRVQDMFGTPRPNVLAPPWTRMDYHFILCAVQSGAWEAAHQALRTVPDNLHARTRVQDQRQVWQEYLETWLMGLEKDCQCVKNSIFYQLPDLHPCLIRLREEYFATTPSADSISPQTLLLWHMTMLKLNAPPDVWGLQGRYYKLRSTATPPPPPPGQQQQQPTSSSLRTWQSTKQARTAIWHSAQIARILSGELPTPNNETTTSRRQRIRLNPLLIPTLLTSAFIVCSYARHIAVCPSCTGGGPLDLVFIFNAPDRCGRLDRWLDDPKDLLASWGQNVFIGFPLCQCRVSMLYDWFRKLLEPWDDEHAAGLRALALFIDEVMTGIW